MFALAASHHLDQTVARGLSFAALISGSLALIFVNRSWSQGIKETLRNANAAVWIVAVGAIATLLSVLYIPFLSDVFRFGHPRVPELAFALAAGASGALFFELVGLRGLRRVS